MRVSILFFVSIFCFCFTVQAGEIEGVIIEKILENTIIIKAAKGDVDVRGIGAASLPFSVAKGNNVKLKITSGLSGRASGIVRAANDEVIVIKAQAGTMGSYIIKPAGNKKLIEGVNVGDMASIEIIKAAKPEKKKKGKK